MHDGSIMLPAQTGIKIARRNISNLRYADNTTLMEESEELKSLRKVKKESENFGLKLNIQKTKIIISGSITSWKIGAKKERMQILFSWAPKSLWTVTASPTPGVHPDSCPSSQ